MKEFEGVLVHGELNSNGVSENTLALLGCGRRLADDLGQTLNVVFIGHDIDGKVRSAAAFGADHIYLVQDPLLEDYQTDSYTAVMSRVVEKVKPQIIILGQTTIGRDLAPRLAFRLDTAATLDCVELSIDPGSKMLLQTKPVFGGIALATYTCPIMPQIVTVRSKAMSPQTPDHTRQAKVVPLEVALDPSVIRTRVLEKNVEQVQGVQLEDANVVVSGGRGMGSPEGFKQLEELAGLLKGALGATRPSCDEGWAPYGQQIGLTGKIITPELYIAVAISGASQHLSGISGAKTVVAINKDAEANIFKAAHYGIVGEWQTVLPAFVTKLRELLNE